MYGITVLSSYAIIMVLATLLLTKRETVAEAFHVGNRNMGTLQSAMSIAATWIWAPALFTSAEKAYANGYVGLFWFLVPNVLCLLLFIPFAQKIRKVMPNGITLAGFMGEAYGQKVRGIYLFQLTNMTMDNASLFAPLQSLQWVDRSLLKPNDYNPNKVSKENLKLLTQSILTNGWTLPIVVRPDYTIIDGFHRWTVSGQEPLFSALGGKVPIVVVDHKDSAEDIYGTVTHNRARGTHLLEPMKAIVKKLLDEGKTVDEIGKELGMKPEEIFRLSDFSKEDFLRMMVTKDAHSNAELFTLV